MAHAERAAGAEAGAPLASRRGDLDEAGLLEAGAELRRLNRLLQREAGIDLGLAGPLAPRPAAWYKRPAGAVPDKPGGRGGTAIPVYDYRCNTCGHTFSRRMPVEDRDRATCPRCRAPAAREFGIPYVAVRGGAGCTASSCAGCGSRATCSR